MRVLLRSTETGHYYLEQDRWSTDRWSARDFSTSGRAMLFALESCLSNVEVVLAFEDPRYDVSMPVSTPPRGQPPSGGSGGLAR